MEENIKRMLKIGCLFSLIIIGSIIYLIFTNSKIKGAGSDCLVGSYLDGEYSKEIPSKNDGCIVDKIVCDNGGVATWNSDIWGIMLNNLTEKTKCNIYFKKNLTNKILDLAKNDTVNLASDDPDNNVRYIGANPNNYIYFNCSDYNNPTANTCELWRIIGVFNNVSKSDGTNSSLVKIIRNDSLGEFS